MSDGVRPTGVYLKSGPGVDTALSNDSAASTITLYALTLTNANTESSIADLHWQKMVMVSKQTEANLLKEFRKK